MDPETCKQIDEMRSVAFSVNDRILASVWIPEHVRIPDQTESPGPFDVTLFPHVLAVLEAVDDIEVEEIILIWSTRNGKTFTTLALIPFWVVQRSKPIGFASSDGKNLGDNVDKKLYPMLEATPATSDRVPPHHLRNSKEVSIGKVTVVLANAKSKNTLANFPAQLVIANEVGLWPMNSVQRLRQRLRNFKLTAKAILEGKPETKGQCTISRLAGGADVQRRIRQVPCPHCGTYQPLIWGWGRSGAGVKWEHQGGHSTEQLASRSAYYECVNGCRIMSDQRPEMIRRGVWAPEGQTVTKEGILTGTPTVVSKKRVAFVRLSALYSLMVPGWGAIVGEWFEVKDNKELIREFVTGTLAEEYDPKPKSKEFSEVAARLSCQVPQGMCPAWSRFAVLVVDCGFHTNSQQLEFWWQYQAWGMMDDRVRGHIVDWGYSFGIEQFKTTFRTIQYPHMNGGVMRPVKTGVDFGDGNVSAKILLMCNELNQEQTNPSKKNKVIPLKGDSRRDTAPGWYVHGYFDDRKERELNQLKKRGQCDFITVRTHNTQSWREGLVSGIIEPNDKDFVSLPREVGVHPEDYESFLNEFTADYRSENQTWERSGRNENGDLLRYGRAMASLHTNHDKNWLRICSAKPLTEAPRVESSVEDENPFSLVGQGMAVSLFKGTFSDG